jgi:general secretion pathway protein K
MRAEATMYTRALCQLRRDESRPGEQGVVLILAVFAVVLLTVLAVAITAAVRVELLASRTSLDRVQSLFLAEAGLSQARALLLYDDVTIDTLLDSWAPGSELLLDLPQELGTGFYRVRVHDACGRIDINKADYATLVRLTGDPSVAAAILDWRDLGNMPTPEGAEEEYYGSLPYPYLPRNASFQTPGELLLVRGVTPDMFFGTDEQKGLIDLVTVESLSPNTNAMGRQRLGVNELIRLLDMQRFRDQLLTEWAGVFTQEILDALLHWKANLPSRQYTSLAQVADALDHYVNAQGQYQPIDFLPVIDNVYIDDTTPQPGPWMPPGWRHPPAVGKVNVNTALPEVIAALPGGSSGLTETFVARREAEPFASSSTFVVESMGWTGIGRAFRTLQASVRRAPDMVAVVRQAEEDWPLPPSEQETVVAARR